jgi:hypothetical protein
MSISNDGEGGRVIRLLEEMGLAYRLRPVDLLPASRKTRNSWPSTPPVHPGDHGRRRHDGRVDVVHTAPLLGPRPKGPTRVRCFRSLGLSVRTVGLAQLGYGGSLSSLRIALEGALDHLEGDTILHIGGN